MTLKEAIEIMEIYAYDYGIGDTPSMRIVLAAARAFACGCENGVIFTGTPHEKPCPNCAEDRKLASSHLVNAPKDDEP